MQTPEQDTTTPTHDVPIFDDFDELALTLTIVEHVPTLPKVRNITECTRCYSLVSRVDRRGFCQDCR